MCLLQLLHFTVLLYFMQSVCIWSSQVLASLASQLASQIPIQVATLPFKVYLIYRNQNASLHICGKSFIHRAISSII